MLDPGDYALGNVRIDLDLRRRRNDNGNRDAGDIGNVNIVRDVDNLRDAGNLGIVGNVRFRLEQYCFIVGANVDVTHNVGWHCSNGNPAGIYRDRKSWGQLRSSGANDERAAPCGYGGAGPNDARHYLSARCFIRDDKHFAVPDHRAHRNVEYSGRLLKQLIRELDRP
jgi:hypothetical protein